MRRRINLAGPGEQKIEELAVPRASRFADIATISAPYANGTMSIDLPVGRYTYFGHQISIECAAEVAGVTTEFAGRHWVDNDHIPDYIENIAFEINGTPETDVSTSWLYRINKYSNQLDASELQGALSFRHGTPRLFDSLDAGEAFALGTKNLDNVRFLLDLSSSFDPNTMTVRFISEYARAARPIGPIMSHKMRSYTTGGVGDYVITDLPVSYDMSRLFIRGDNIDGMRLDVDGETLVDASTREIQIMHAMYGKRPEWAYLDLVWDNIRSGHHRDILRSLTSPEQRKRQARFELTLRMTAANVPIEMIIETAGFYRAR